MMSSLYHTYQLDGTQTLHSWSQSSGQCLPCNESLFDTPLVRTDKPPQGSRPWTLAKPQHALTGDPFMLMAKINLSRNRSKKERPAGWKATAKTKDEAMAYFLKKAGLEKAGKCDISAETDLRIHGRVEVNTFVVTGFFKVVDQNAFAQAYNHGVGRRRTYGCGLIVVI